LYWTAAGWKREKALRRLVAMSGTQIVSVWPRRISEEENVELKFRKRREGDPPGKLKDGRVCAQCVHHYECDTDMMQDRCIWYPMRFQADMRFME
jgi:hypothetical protein